MQDKVEVFWFSEQPYGFVTEKDLEKHDSGRLGFPNSYFDPHKAHVLYNEYHEQYALADEVGFDGIMTNEHHAAYWCMKPAVNLDAAVISKLTKRVKIAILGNVIAVNDPIRMAEEIAMLDCYSNGRVISGFVRGTAVESIQGGIDPTENRERFEEAHDLIIKCWTEPRALPLRGQALPLPGGEPVGAAHPEAPSAGLVSRPLQSRERCVVGHPPAPVHEPGLPVGAHGAAEANLLGHGQGGGVHPGPGAFWLPAPRVRGRHGREGPGHRKDLPVDREPPQQGPSRAQRPSGVPVPAGGEDTGDPCREPGASAGP